MPTLSRPWGAMAYVNDGERGQPLLFLHGTGCDTADWLATWQALSPTVRKVGLDFCGHGESAVPPSAFTLGDLAEDVVALMEHCGLERVLVVGHSLGGMVAMQAARQTERIAGLVLLEGWTSLAAARTAFAPGRFYGTLSPLAVAGIQRKHEATRARFTPEAWAHFWQSVEAFDGYAMLATTRLPILEVYGDLGRHPQTEARLRVPPNPYIAWHWIPNAGHYLPHERPQDVVQICLAATGEIE